MRYRKLCLATLAGLLLWSDPQTGQAGSAMDGILPVGGPGGQRSDGPIGYLLAAMNNNGNDWTYGSCQQGCEDSHEYCQEHQSEQMDCNQQADICYRWCDEEFDKPPIVAIEPPKMSHPKAITPGPFQPQLHRPGPPRQKFGPKPVLRHGKQKRH